MASTVAGFLVAGGMGALVNCYMSSTVMIPLGLLLQEVFVQPLVALRSLLPVMFGFLGGTLVLLVWHFLKTRVVRFLLDYNGWFLTPRHPTNKVSLITYISIFTVVYLTAMVSYDYRAPRSHHEGGRLVPRLSSFPPRATAGPHLQNV